MKGMITILSLLSISSFAGVCEQELETIHFYDLDKKENYTVHNEQWAALTDELFAPIKALGFEREQCEGAIHLSDFTAPSGIRYEAYYTYEDYCDGGNTYGYIKNKYTNEVVALVHDSDITCN